MTWFSRRYILWRLSLKINVYMVNDLVCSMANSNV